MAAGGINAALGNLDKEDNWEQHFIDTYLEGYGIADPDKVEIMTKESPSLFKIYINIFFLWDRISYKKNLKR